MAITSRLIVLFLLSLLASALTSTGAANSDVQKSAEATCRKSGPEYKPVYDAGGMPLKCEAPPKPMCFFGAYTDPKTSLPGCCGKGNGTFSTDPVNTQEGGCCVSPKTYSFDAASKKGSCCDPGQSYSVDMGAGVGGCCSSPLTYKCSCAAAADTPATDKPATDKPAVPDDKKDDAQPVTSDVPKRCPEADGWTFTQDGVDYMIDCKHGWAQKLGQGDWTKATDIWECLKNCGAAGPKCQGVNYWAQTQDCGFALTWEYPATGDGDPDLMAAIPIKQKT